MLQLYAFFVKRVATVVARAAIKEIKTESGEAGAALTILGLKVRSIFETKKHLSCIGYGLSPYLARLCFVKIDTRYFLLGRGR